MSLSRYWYFDCTTQQCRDWSIQVDIEKWFNESNQETTALSMHAKDKHEDFLSLKTVAVIRKCPKNLRWEELCFIQNYRNDSLVLNK